MKCSCLALFLLFYMIHDDSVIFPLYKECWQCSGTRYILKNYDNDDNKNPRERCFYMRCLDLSPAWTCSMVPKQMQAEDEFCLERYLALSLHSVCSSYRCKARFADVVPLPEAVFLGQWAKSRRLEGVSSTMTLQEHKTKQDLSPWQHTSRDIPSMPLLYPRKSNLADLCFQLLGIPVRLAQPSDFCYHCMGSAQHSAFTRDAEMNSMHHCPWCLCQEQSPRNTAWPLFPPTAPRTPICSCSSTFLSRENAFLNPILVLSLHNSAAPTAWFCPVVVSEPGFEARRTVNPLLRGCGLAESSGKGRKSQLKIPHLFVCLIPVWKPFYFSFALGQYQAIASERRVMSM